MSWPRRVGRFAVVLLVVGAFCCAGTAGPASAFNPAKPVCGAAGLVNGAAGKACSVLQNAGRVAKAGKQLVTGHLGGAAKSLLGGGTGSGASTATTALALGAIGAWVLGGARYVLHQTSTVLDQSSTPQLGTTWFSSTYWRIAGMAAVLTLPFLFAAGVQAVMRSDLALLARATLGYLPLAMLAVSIAAPVTMLLLSAADQVSRAISSAAGNASVHFLTWAGVGIGGLTAVSGSPFLAFLVGAFTVAAALVLWIELLMREAAVYVLVLMMPLAFAALVWPARRVWAIRAVELLVALILSKLAIVAVLSLGGAALASNIGHHSVTALLAGAVLLILGALAPWAVLRLVPLSELASSTVGSLRDGRGAKTTAEFSEAVARSGHEWATSTTSQMRRDASEADQAPPATNGKHAPAEAEIGRLLEQGAADSRAHPEKVQAQEEKRGEETLQPEQAAPEEQERLPGMEPMWQQPDWSWEPLVLGLEESPSRSQDPPAQEGAVEGSEPPAAPGEFAGAPAGAERIKPEQTEGERV